MDKLLKKNISGLIILTIIIFLIGLTIFKLYFSAYYFWFFPVLMLIFLLVNGGFIVFFHKSLPKPANQFIRSFMISTGIKLIIYFFLILIYIFTSPKTAIAFAISLSIAYLAYTAYDLIVMLSLLKHKKENINLTKHLSN